MRRKDSTVECKFVPELTELLFDIDEEYRSLGAELTITSGSELSAKHSDSSLHYSGRAADLRIHNVNRVPKELYDEILLVCTAYCKEKKIPANWVDLVLEIDHLHVEYQPKRLRQ